MQSVPRTSAQRKAPSSTDLLLELDRWTGFSKHFTHLKTVAPAKDQTLLLTAILADGINLGISKMAEACLGTTALFQPRTRPPQ